MRGSSNGVSPDSAEPRHRLPVFTYMGRRRSRSRERERSRSRSCSGSGGRSRVRASSRSRSRSRSRGRPWGQTRSRSPFHDRGHESYGWRDRRSGSGRPSQICKNFEAGICRRGSECRFRHIDCVKNKGDNCSDTDLPGRRRSRPEAERDSKYSYANPWNKFSDEYEREDELPRNRIRGTVSCRDFMKGNCRYGAACRFSHDSSSGNDNFERGFRDAPIDLNHEHCQNKAGNTLCKFFLAGKCQRDNCRFSHDATISSDLDIRTDDSNRGQSMSDLNKWNGSMWDEAAKPSNIRTPSRWGEGGAANMDLSEANSVDQRGDLGCGHSSENEIKILHSPAYDDKGYSKDKYHAFSRGDGYNGGDMRTAMPMVAGNSFGEQFHEKSFNEDKYHACYSGNGGDMGTTQSPLTRNSFGKLEGYLNSKEFISLTADGLPHEKIENLKGAPSSFLSTTSTLPKVSMNSDIHQYQGLAEYNCMEVFIKSKSIKDTDRQGDNPDKRIGFSEHSSFNVTDQSQPMLSAISNALKIDLNGPEQHTGSPLNLHNHESHQQEVTALNLQESSVPFPSTAGIAQVAPKAAPPSLLTQSFEDELKTQLPRALYSPNSMALAPCPNTYHLVPTDINNAVRSLHQYNHVDGFAEHAMSGNTDQPPGNTSYSNQLESQEPVGLLSSLSFPNAESGKSHQDGGLPAECADNAKLKQHESTEKPEVNGNGNTVAAGSNIAREDIDPENVNVQGKDEDGNINKDDKAMRLFKNALVEFVKEILKPKWKEGRMSREVHKTIVKKVVHKVAGSVQGEQVPKTQDRIEQYLSSSKPKISKLVQAYVERSRKTDS